jgi:hypothetical protein
MPSRRATGTPRSVTTTSSPSLARSNHLLRCALRSLTATSIETLYISIATNCTNYLWRYPLTPVPRPQLPGVLYRRAPLANGGYLDRHTHELVRTVSASKRRKPRGRVRRDRIDGPEIQIRREAAYIVERALRGESRVVSIGPLVFFSTPAGDAWMLDPADGLARCLARDGSPLPDGITETADRFTVDWNVSYSIDGDVFTVIEGPGRVIGIFGYPVAEIRRAARRTLR